MKLEQSFTVEAPIEQVWEALVDVERVAPCLPGAQITGRDEETGAYKGTFSVKLGPTTASYNGTLRLEDTDESAHTATMSAKGTDKRGQGGANATIVSVLRAEDARTVVEVDTDFNITGRLARFGRGGMIEDVSKRLLRDFSSCLAATLQTPAAAADQADAAVASAGGAAAEATAAATPSPAAPDSTSAPPQPGAGAAAGDGEPAPATPQAAAPQAADAAPQTAATTPQAAAAAPQAASAPEPGAPLNAFSLLRGVLLDRLKRLWARIGRAVNEWRRRRRG
jgi:carbon monoxide dehydrogenase subunit G